MGQTDGKVCGSLPRRAGSGSGVGAASKPLPGALEAHAAARPDSAAQALRPLLIVNADDFGASASVNAAVLRAHREGVLTSASLMVTGEAFEQAVEMARRAPGLAVGLHLVLLHGCAASPRERVPHLADAAGRLPSDPVGFGLRLAFDSVLQREVVAEIEAQLERFAATGLPLSHVDGHLNFHLHPAVFTRLARAAAGRGARGIRLPRDDLALAMKHDRRRILPKLFLATAFGLLSAWARRRLPAGMHAADRVYGLFESGGLTSSYLRDVIAELREGSAEVYAHPATEASGEALGPNPGDLAALCDPGLPAAVRAAGIRLGGYAALGAA